jgi:hypothetical protein
MDQPLRESLWMQFGATIDMLENAVALCPEHFWDTGTQFWYSAYHTIFYLDYYLSSEPDDFMPPTPFTLSEFDPDGEMPNRVYTKAELLDYLEFTRKKCFELIDGLTAENAAKRFVNPYRDYSMFEMILYNMRHVQHHAGQLNLLLRQNIDDAPRWVSQTKKPY